jgi:hypothetical protein
MQTEDRPALARASRCNTRAAVIFAGQGDNERNAASALKKLPARRNESSALTPGLRSRSPPGDRIPEKTNPNPT